MSIDRVDSDFYKKWSLFTTLWKSKCRIWTQNNNSVLIIMLCITLYLSQIIALVILLKDGFLEWLRIFIGCHNWGFRVCMAISIDVERIFKKFFKFFLDIFKKFLFKKVDQTVFLWIFIEGFNLKPFSKSPLHYRRRTQFHIPSIQLHSLQIQTQAHNNKNFTFLRSIY